MKNLRSWLVNSEDLTKSIDYAGYFDAFTEFIESNKLKLDERAECLSLISYLLVGLCSSNQKKSDFLFSAFKNSKGIVFNQLIMLLSQGRAKEIKEYLSEHEREKRRIIQERKAQKRGVREDPPDLNSLRN